MKTRNRKEDWLGLLVDLFDFWQKACIHRAHCKRGGNTVVLLHKQTNKQRATQRPYLCLSCSQRLQTTFTLSPLYPVSFQPTAEHLGGHKCCLFTEFNLRWANLSKTHVSHCWHVIQLPVSVNVRQYCGTLWVAPPASVRQPDRYFSMN